MNTGHPEAAADLADVIRGAWQRMFDLPVLGPVSREIWASLDLGSIAQPVFASLVEKAELTSRDDQQHSFMMMLPAPRDGLTVVVVGIAWPKPLAAASKEAREQCFRTRATWADRLDSAGILQIDVFFGAPSSAELRMAWLPPPGASGRLPPPLQRLLLPWGSEPQTGDDAGPPPPEGHDVVALAEIAWRLTGAMQKRLRSWPDEHVTPSRGFHQVRERCTRVAEEFNTAAARVGLEHAMPVSKFDDTWQPHNLGNALRFQSLPASLKADLLRIWGPEARDRFAQAWALLQEAKSAPRPDDALARLRESPLNVQRNTAASRTPTPVDAFISYAWSDKTRGARDIYEALTASGLSAWLDEEQLLNDATLNAGIDDAMLRSRCIVICMSLEMIVRGGYALREILLAISCVPERCLIARLNRMPLPAICAGLRTVDWCEQDGPDDLLRAVRQQIAADTSVGTPGRFTFANPLVDRLMGSVNAEGPRHRCRDTSNRKQQLMLRGRLFNAVHIATRLHVEGNWDAILKLVAGADEFLAWSSLCGQAAREDPTVFGAALRLRSCLFRAHIHVGVHADCEVHNRSAFQYLEEVVGIEPDLLRPAPECGWHTEDCRLAVQDCLDVLEQAKDWFRGWSPRTLVLTCEVPSVQAETVESRINARTAVLVDRMLALRAWDERRPVAELAPSWPTIWSSLRKDLAGKLQAGSHPTTRAYFEELSRWLTQPLIDELATAMADGVVESAGGERYREELLFELPAFCLRIVIRSGKSLGSQRDSLASVRGTVLEDLRGEGSDRGDLSLLFWIFTEQGTPNDDSKYGLYMNCAPAERADGALRLPPILLNTFLMAEMLTEHELASIHPTAGTEVYEEM